MKRRGEGGWEAEGPAGGGSCSSGTTARTDGRKILSIFIVLGVLVILAGLSGSLGSGSLVLPMITSALVHLLLAGLAVGRKAPPTKFLLLFLSVQSLSLFVVPVLDVYLGPVKLPQVGVGSDEKISMLIFLGTCFSVAFSVPWLIGRGQGINEGDLQGGSGLGLFLMLAGVLGLLLRFNSSPGSGATGAGGLSAVTEAGKGLGGLLAGVLLPLLTPGLLVLSKKWTERRSLWWLLPVWIAVASALLSFMLNRATMLVSLAAAVILWHIRVGKIPRRIWLTLVGLAISVFMVIGTIRAAALAAWNPYKSSSWILEFVQQVQIYGQSPSMLSSLTNFTATGYDLRSFTGSLIGPLPGIGASFRGQSGTALWNYGIYGMGSGVRDFILPGWLEMYLTFGVVGLLVGGLLVGALARRLSSLLSSSASPLIVYAATVGVIWLSLAGVVSISVLVQSFFYQVAASLGIGVGLSLTRYRRRVI